MFISKSKYALSQEYGKGMAALNESHKNQAIFYQDRFNFLRSTVVQDLEALMKKNDPITKAELAAIISRAKGIE